MRLSRMIPRSIAAIAVIISLTLVTPIEGLDRDLCYANTRRMLEDGILARDDPVFYRDENGLPMSGVDAPVLTLSGCQKLCGANQSWYRDIGPRLSTWLIPGFLLITNLEVSPLDKRRYLMILHLLGDPIDSMWSLVTKLEALSRCYALAENHSGPHERRVRNLATVLAGIEELVEPQVNPKTRFDSLLATSGLPPAAKARCISETACDLADSRTDEMLRTCFAFVLYLYQILAAFIATVGGGNTSRPGGRIGTAMFISWVVPSILLSNAIGGFTSCRTCFRILERFARRVSPYEDNHSSSGMDQISPQFQSYHTTITYFDSQSWSGVIYTYRPEKERLFAASQKDHGPLLLFLLSILPVVISTTTALIITWKTPPEGLNCRCFWMIAISFAWLLSVFITWFTWRAKLATGKSHWYLILAKDAAIALSTVALVFLSSSGLFNSCWCWSGVYIWRSKAHVPLNPVAQFDFNGRTIYPALVGVCLALQLGVFACMAWIGRGGLRIVRWSESERHHEWDRFRR